jgi:hypothetical protein
MSVVCGTVAVSPSHRTLTTQKKLAYLTFHCLDHPPFFSGSGPVGLSPVPWIENTIETSPFCPTRAIAAAEIWLDGQPSEFFFSGLQNL